MVVALSDGKDYFSFFEAWKIIYGRILIKMSKCVWALRIRSSANLDLSNSVISYEQNTIFNY